MIKAETYTLEPRFSETVLAELDTRFSRKVVRLAPTTGPLPFGLVLMKNANGTYAPLSETPASGEGESATPAKLDGEAAAILISHAEASGEAQEALVLTGYCIVNKKGLVFDESVTGMDAAIEALEARGIIVKEA